MNKLHYVAKGTATGVITLRALDGGSSRCEHKVLTRRQRSEEMGLLKEEVGAMEEGVMSQRMS